MTLGQLKWYLHYYKGWVIEMYLLRPIHTWINTKRYGARYLNIKGNRLKASKEEIDSLMAIYGNKTNYSS